jgi:hypothetical protein
MKKNHIIAALAAAGVLTAGLLAYKMQSGGSFGLPASLVALTPWGDKPTPMKREFPSQASAPEVVAEGTTVSAEGETPAPDAAVQVDGALPGGEVVAGAAQPAAGGIPDGLADDVDSRIARAQELSKMLMNEAAKPAAPAATAQSGKPVVAGPAAYAGEWTGEFFGPDAGTVAVAVSPDGTVRGRGLSTMTSLSFNLVGKVQGNGQVELTKSAAGVTSTGAVFTGSLSHSGQGKGTWSVPNYDVSGTWQLNAKPVQ